MELLKDILNDLMDSDISLVNPLNKAKVLASRINNQELLKWVNNELNGYDLNDELPSYRIHIGILSGSYYNLGGLVNNQTLATYGIPEPYDTKIKELEFHQSIGALEESKRNNKSGTISKIFTAEQRGMIEENLQRIGNPHLRLISAQSYTSVSTITEILSRVRSIFIDFILNLEKEFGMNIKIDDLKRKHEKVSEIAVQNFTINGTGGVINTGDKSKINTKTIINISDKDSLKRELIKYNIDEGDANELLEIIDEEKPNNESGKFGDKVNSWIGKMMSKSLSGTWEVGIGTAGNLLSNLLSSYYGI